MRLRSPLLIACLALCQLGGFHAPREGLQGCCARIAAACPGQRPSSLVSDSRKEPAWRGPPRDDGAVLRRAAEAAATAGPRELVDLYGMKTRELKAFLVERGVHVDDCYDTASLIERAAATESDWAGIAPPSASTGSPTGPAPDAAVPSTKEVEGAWTRVCQAWPGKEPVEHNPADGTASMTVIMLHGFGDTDARYVSDIFTSLQRIEGLRLVLPQAPEETLQGQKLQSWFLPTNGQWIVDDNVAGPITAYLHAMIRREIARGVPSHRIVLGGFAQGGSPAMRAALSFPDASLGGAVLLSSFLGAPDAAVAPANRGLPTLVCHGRKDETVPFSEGERAAGLLRGLLPGPEQVIFKEYDMNHGVATDEVMDILEFLNARMEAEPGDQLQFDPAGFSSPDSDAASDRAPRPKPNPFSTEPTEGVPELDPKDLLQLMHDEDVLEATKDPEGMAVIQDIIMNPANVALHRGNARVAKLVDKIESVIRRVSKGESAVAGS